MSCILESFREACEESPTYRIKNSNSLRCAAFCAPWLSAWCPPPRAPLRTQRKPPGAQTKRNSLEPKQHIASVYIASYCTVHYTVLYACRHVTHAAPTRAAAAPTHVASQLPNSRSSYRLLSANAEGESFEFFPTCVHFAELTSGSCQNAHEPLSHSS